jgi:hypothetical protein
MTNISEKFGMEIRLIKYWPTKERGREIQKAGEK